MNLETFRTLTPDQQRETLQEMHQRIQENYRAAFDELCVHDQLEASLVPQIQFKSPSRVEISPPTGDPEQAARDFFRQFPDTKSIRIGNVLYERG